MVLAVLGRQVYAPRDRLTRAPGRERFTVERHRPGARGPDTEDRLHQLGPPGAHQAGEPQDLAAPGLEADAGRCPGDEQVLDVQHHLARGPAGLVREVRAGELAPDHQRDDLVRGRLGARQIADAAAVAQHRDPIGEQLHLFHAVRDVDDADAVRCAAGG